MDLTTYLSFLLVALFVKVCQTCVDDPAFSQAGNDCSSHVALASFNCYDTNVEASCCASCATVKRNVNGCEYGDRKACFVFECESLIDKSECCETCGTPATTTSTTSTGSTTTTTSVPPTSSAITTPSTRTTTTAATATTSTTSTSTRADTSAVPVTSAATSATSSTATTAKRTTLSTSDTPTVTSTLSTNQTSPAITVPTVLSSSSPQSSPTTVSAMPTDLSSGTTEQSSVTDLTTGNMSTTPLSMSTSNLTTAASNETSSVSPDVTEASSRVLSELELGLVIGFSSIGLVLVLAAAGLTAYCWRRKRGGGSSPKYSKSDYRLMDQSYVGRDYKYPATGPYADISVVSLPQTNEVYVPYSGYSGSQNGDPGSMYYSSIVPQTSLSSETPYNPYLYAIYDGGARGNGGNKRPYSVSDRYLYRPHRSNSNLSTRNSDVNNGGWRRSTSALYSDRPRSRV